MLYELHRDLLEKYPKLKSVVRKNYLKNIKKTSDEFKFYKIRNNKNFNKQFLLLKKKIFLELTKKLNRYHNKKLSILAWKIILEPWFTTYISKNIYYWNLIDFYKKKNIFYFDDLENIEPPFDTIHFYELSQHNIEYNIHLLQKILKYKNSNIKKIINLKIKTNIYQKINYKKYFIEKNNILKKIYHKLFFLFLKNNKIIFDLSNISFKNLIFNFKFFQLPLWIDYTLNLEKYKDLYIGRSKTNFLHRLKYKKKSSSKEILNFLRVNIFDDLPKVFFEDFIKIEDLTKKVKLSPKIIVSDNKEFNLFFKFWIAINKKEIKFITSDHGASYASNLDETTHEEYSDLSLRWFNLKNKKTIQLPIITDLKKRDDISKRSKVLIITHSVANYPHHILWSPIGNQNYNQVKILRDFFITVNPIIKDKIYLKTYPEESQNNKWSCNNEFQKILPKKKIIKNKKLYKDIFFKSSLNICLYPQTAFIESILSGPTILIVNENFYNIRSEFKQIHHELKKAKILFNNGHDAAKHISQVWYSLDEWWRETSVIKARLLFEKQTCKNTKINNAVNQWFNFFKNYNSQL